MKNLINFYSFCLILVVYILWIGCFDDNDLVPNEIINNPTEGMNNIVCGDTLVFDYKDEQGCDGQYYNDPNTLEYIIPLDAGTKFKMGLSNCSSSYHAAGNPDQYAYDFDLPEGSIFTAAKPGIVTKIVEDQSSFGGGAGNYVVIDHEDTTFGLYYHSPKDGITVEEGDKVGYGEKLGLIGRSGLAGYPHLHFIVTQGDYAYPFKSIPVSFSNVSPPTVVLESFATYEVCW